MLLRVFAVKNNTPDYPVWGMNKTKLRSNQKSNTFLSELTADVMDGIEPPLKVLQTHT
jgi:hypothetical protein